MKRAFLSLLAASSLPAAEMITLFDGASDGWKMAGPGGFDIADGIATAKDGMGLWWHEKELSNFSLHLEFKLDDPSQNSGIFVRFPDPGDDPWVAVKQGYEIQICDTKPGDKSTGSIYAIQAATQVPLKVGEWNRYHIIAANEKIAVLLNGQLVNIFETQRGRGDQKGHIGLQNHDPNSPVQFRKVQVQEWDPNFSLLEILARAGVPRYQLTKYWSLRTPAQPVMLPKRGGGLRQGGKDWYRVADHGPLFFQSYADWFQGQARRESALKGAVISYSSIPTRMALFNTETLSMLSATDQGTALHGVTWAGGHGPVNKFLNQEKFLFNNIEGPAWADEKGSFEDQRPLKGHGNLSYAKFDGYTRLGNNVVLDYTVHGTKIHDLVVDHQFGMARLLEIAPHEQPLVHRLTSDHPEGFAVKLDGEGATITQSGKVAYLNIAPSDRTQYLSLLYTPDGQGKPYPLARLTRLSMDFYQPISKEIFTVTPKIDSGDKPWLVDDIPLPPMREASPYESTVRTSDFDFFRDGDRALVSTWDGDIWLVSGLRDWKKVTWKRYATGFFEPLGIKIQGDVPYVAGRDAIWKLTDVNGDDEADRFEIFNNDVLITNNFHEFQFGLETDSKGNFYFAKGSPVLPGGRGFDKIVPHNGAFMKVSADGSKLEVIATGLRAPGGIGVGPQGQITTGENEGTWQPCCKINYHEPRRGVPFFGVEDTRHQNQSLFTEPICYLPMTVDNSGGSQEWVPRHARIGVAPGELLHLSYGQSSIYHVLKERVTDGFYQGGVVRLPLKLGSSAQRANFHPADGSLYVTGFRGWQTNAANEAAFQRVRHNSKVPKTIPIGMQVTQTGVKLIFDTPLDGELANDPGSFTAKRWKYIRSKQYGSGHFSVDNPNLEAERVALEKESKSHRVEDKVKVLKATLLPDQMTVVLDLEGHKPTQQLRLDYDLESKNGNELIGTIHSTIHRVP